MRTGTTSTALRARRTSGSSRRRASKRTRCEAPAHLVGTLQEERAESVTAGSEIVTRGTVGAGFLRGDFLLSSRLVVFAGLTVLQLQTQHAQRPQHNRSLSAEASPKLFIRFMSTLARWNGKSLVDVLLCV